MAAPDSQEKQLIIKFRERLADLELTEEQNSDMDLLRWLRAREYNLDRAEEMLSKHLKYREENDLDNDENYKPPAHFHNNFPYEIIGFDPENSPVIIFQSGRWDFKSAVNSGEMQEFFRLKDHINESLVRKMRGKVTSEGVPVTQSVSIVDLGQVSFRQTSISVLQMLKEDVGRFETNYPERLKATYIINVPWFFSIAMNFVRPFLTKRTLDKFNIFNTDQSKWMPILKELVPLDNLPTIYGGLDDKSRLNHFNTEK